MAEEKTKQDKKVGSWHLGITFTNLLMSSIQYQRSRDILEIVRPLRMIWEIIENCHEAIISPEEWDKVQELIDRRPPIMQGNACPFYNLFHGIIYCATCGKPM